MLSCIKNERGSTLIGALIMVVLLGYMGASVLELTGGSTAGGVNELQSVQALQVGNGGIQHSLDKLNQGEDPDVNAKTLGPGTFTVTSDPSTNAVTVSATVGIAKKTQSLTADFAAECVEMDVDIVELNSKDIEYVELEKTCNAKAIIDMIKIEWDTSACVQALVCDGNTNNPTPTLDPADSKVTICHVPPGNPANAHTITIGASAVPAHLAEHAGDAVGACAGDPATPLVCEGYDAQVAACGGPNGGSTQVKALKIDTAVLGTSLNADSGTVINVNDFTMVTNEVYEFTDITFEDNPSYDWWYRITVIFKDGSSVVKSFKFE